MAPLVARGCGRGRSGGGGRGGGGGWDEMALRIGAQLAETAESSHTVRRSLRLRDYCGSSHWTSTDCVSTAKKYINVEWRRVEVYKYVYINISLCGELDNSCEKSRNVAAVEGEKKRPVTRAYAVMVWAKERPKSKRPLYR